MDYRKIILLSNLQSSKSVELERIIQETQASERTIKSDIAELNVALGGEYIFLWKNIINVNNREDFLLKSNSILRNTSFATYKLSKEERTQLEILLFFFSDGYITAEYFCNYLMISRGTVLNDFKYLKSLLKKYDLKLLASTNHGYKIEGPEVNFRDLALEIIDSKDPDYGVFFNTEKQTIVYDKIDIDKLSNEILLFSKKYKLELSDFSFHKFLNYIIISVKRSENMRNLERNTLSKIENSALFTDYNKLLLNCGIKNNTKQINEMEILWIHNKIDSVKNHQENLGDSADEQMKISSFIWKVCQDFNIITLFGYDNYSNLYQHIALTISYLRDNIDVSVNPFCEELKTQYPEIFHSIEKNIYIIQELVDNREISENDISYIAMHIATVIEGKNNNFKQLTAAIVCSRGRCVSLLLKARILKYFPIKISDVYPAYMSSAIDNVDFIISTVPIHESKVPVIQVNQMFLEEDVDKLQSFIKKLNSKNFQNGIMKEIEHYMSEYENLNLNSPEANAELKKLNYKYQRKDDSERLYFYRALQVDHIKLDQDAKDWESSIRQTGQLLLDDGYIENRYINQMVELIKENGPYIVFQPGFVIAHAGPKDAAKKLGVSVIRFKHPIDFGISEIKIHFVVCLSIPDKTSHIFLLFQIYKCLCNEDIFQYLLNVSTEDEFISVLRIFETSTVDES
ncbi:PTS transporter subunit EIIA [Faecalicoccus pleomorphus]|uniref:PTS transporter subunit EIIA n=1 Tax=Faecalicoccus pleomorphus TaxID=1323 RepID=A0A7X9NGF6_9FIRM|nr:PTS sugar transporter subunit IIA [Faecalicoccus pleomorphus]NME43773.1 PTS transporter subunit EIIA [Faecalicoccus pleomorphus]